ASDDFTQLTVRHFPSSGVQQADFNPWRRNSQGRGAPWVLQIIQQYPAEFGHAIAHRQDLPRDAVKLLLQFLRYAIGPYRSKAQAAEALGSHRRVQQQFLESRNHHDEMTGPQTVQRASQWLQLVGFQQLKTGA